MQRISPKVDQTRRNYCIDILLVTLEKASIANLQTWVWPGGSKSETLWPTALSKWIIYPDVCEIHWLHICDYKPVHILSRPWCVMKTSFIHAMVPASGSSTEHFWDTSGLEGNPSHLNVFGISPNHILQHPWTESAVCKRLKLLKWDFSATKQELSNSLICSWLLAVSGAYSQVSTQSYRWRPIFMTSFLSKLFISIKRLPERKRWDNQQTAQNGI